MTYSDNGIGFSGHISGPTRAPRTRYAAPAVPKGYLAKVQTPHEDIAKALAATEEHSLEPASAETPAVTLRGLGANLETRTPQAFAEVAHYLDWRGRDWTPADRHKVVQLLRPYAADAGPAVLDKVQRIPRADVLDAAVDVLRPLATTPVGVSLLMQWQASRDHDHAREVCLRVLGHARGAQQETAAGALKQALRDPEPSIREAAIWALVNLKAPGTRQCLQAAQERESDDLVCETLNDALASLSGD